MAPEVKTAKNSKLPKLSENYFEPVGKGGWPLISIWIKKQEKEEVLEKLRVARYYVTAYENEKDEFWEMLEEDKEKIQREKDQLLAEQTTVKEVVNKALLSMPGLAQEEQESVEIQVAKLSKAI
jgi:hypothetical protein